MRGTSRPVISDSGSLNVITIANKHLCKTRARAMQGRYLRLLSSYKQGQGFKTPAATPYLNTGQVPPFPNFVHIRE